MLRIKEVIKEKGLTIEEAAKIIGISRSGLNQHINGNPTVAVLENMAEKLGVNISDFFVDTTKCTHIEGIHCPNCGAELELKKKE